MTDETDTRIKQLEARVDAQQQLIDELKQVILGDYELSEPLVEESDALLNRIIAIEQGDTKFTDRIDPEVRSSVLPIHKAWIDVRQGDGDHVQSKSLRRGARLFARVIWKECEDREAQGVSTGPHNYQISSEQAEAMLEEDDDLDVADASRGQTVLRAMKMAAAASKDYECDCETTEGCTHGIVRYVVNGEAKLQVPKAPLRDYLTEVDAVVNSSVTTSADGANADDADGKSVEADDTAEALRVDADERLEQLAKTDGGPP